MRALDMQSVGEQIFVDPPRPENNIVRIPAAPGLGLKPNVAQLKESLVREIGFEMGIGGW